MLYGKGALKRLSDELEGKGDRAAIITDRTLIEKCTELVESVRVAGYEVKIWDRVEADATLDIALSASRFLHESNPQWVIGFGGGSAIDTAKAAWEPYERPDLAAGDLTKAILPKVKLNLLRKARFVTVPTTSGTGADVTWVTVLTDRAMNRKIVFANNDIVPDLSVLETNPTLALPRDLTASTGLDVIAHAVDGYTSR